MPGVPTKRRMAAFAAVCLFALEAFSAIVYSNKYRSPRNEDRSVRKTTSLIVLHTTEAPAKGSLNKLSERGEAHYCIAENGTVYRIIDQDRIAFHAGRSMWNGKRDVDNFSIGIEVVGYHDKPVTLAQLSALNELLLQLKAKYKIPDSCVVAHSHVAYGAPNKWQKKSHRGRKRCGMLFAMPSVRTKLGLSARPAFDADVKAKRLVNADPALSRALYGPVDTMKNVYGAAKPAAPAKPAANNFWKRAGSKKSAAARPAKAKTASAQAPKTKPPKSQTAKAAPSGKAGSAQLPPDGLRTIGVHGSTLEEIAGDEARSPRTVWFKPDGSWGRGDRLAKGAALPKGTHVLVGYEAAGQVSPKRTASSICGAKWRSPHTYYFNGITVTPGDKVNEKAIRNGTMVFLRK